MGKAIFTQPPVIQQELIENLTASDNTPFRFGVDENGNYGYIITDEEGADTVIPFSGHSSSYLKFDAEAGGIFAMDDTGEWTLIYKTDCLPIYTFDGVLYNAGVFNENYFGSAMVHTVSGGASIGVSTNNIAMGAEAPAKGTVSAMACFSTPIDVRRYKILNITSSGSTDTSASPGVVCYGVGDTTGITSMNALLTYKGVSTAAATTQLDVSNYDEVYLYFYITQSGGSFLYKRYQYVTKIWLTN